MFHHTKNHWNFIIFVSFGDTVIVCYVFHIYLNFGGKGPIDLLTNYFLLNQYKWTAAVSRYESAFLCLMLYLCLSSALPCGFSFALPLVLNKLVILYITVSRLKSCMFVKSLCFVCYMPFWCLCCSSVEVNRCDSRVKGECIILVCCQVCCGQVFLKLNCSSASL